MRKILLIVLAFVMMVGVSLANQEQETQDILDKVIQPPLIDRVMSHPDAVQMGENWYRVVIKENLSNTEFDWRFDMRMIDIKAGHITIGHRLEQNSGSVPDSNWVIEYTFIDLFEDGTLDYFDKSRFISINDDGLWTKTSPFWADKFRYPDLLTEEEALELYKKELEWWDNKL